MVSIYLIAFCLVALVAFKYLNRKDKPRMMKFPDATEEHIHLYSDEYVRVMNERVKAMRESKQAI